RQDRAASAASSTKIGRIGWVPGPRTGTMGLPLTRRRILAKRPRAPGPKIVPGCRIVQRRPERRTSSSAANFVRPYTPVLAGFADRLLIWTQRVPPAFRKASIKLRVPSTFVRRLRSSSGVVSDVVAAAWITASAPSTAPDRAEGSVISPRYRISLGRPRSAVGLRTRARTGRPSRKATRTIRRPKKPEAPVTRIIVGFLTRAHRALPTRPGRLPPG